MHDAPGHHRGAATACYGLLKGVHGQRGLHTAGHGVPHDPPGVHVLDHAEVELALAGGVLGDVCQPEPVRCFCGELTLDVVIVHGRAWPAPVLATPGPERAVPMVLVAQPPGGSGGHGLPGRLGLVPQQPVPELGIVVVGGVQGIGPVGLLHLRGGDGLLPPAVIGLASELEDPQGHRHGDTVAGELGHERVHHFFGRFAWDR